MEKQVQQQSERYEKTDRHSNRQTDLRKHQSPDPFEPSSIPEDSWCVCLCGHVIYLWRVFLTVC